MASRFSLALSGKAALTASLILGLCVSCFSCVTSEERRRGLRKAAAPHIDKLLPSTTIAGVGFLVQPSGDSAISIIGSNFANTSRVHLDGEPAVTTFGSSRGLTAIVPARFFTHEGTIEVTVQNADGQSSNRVLFSVLPAKGPAPHIGRLLPESCVVGVGFNVQPGGESALAIEGANFTPGATIYFDAVPLSTAFGDRTALTAIVPRGLLASARTVKVHVKNPDGQSSQTVSFTVAARGSSTGRQP